VRQFLGASSRERFPDGISACSPGQGEGRVAGIMIFSVNKNLGRKKRFQGDLKLFFIFYPGLPLGKIFPCLPGKIKNPGCWQGLSFRLKVSGE